MKNRLAIGCSLYPVHKNNAEFWCKIKLNGHKDWQVVPREDMLPGTGDWSRSITLHAFRLGIK